MRIDKRTGSWLLAGLALYNVVVWIDLLVFGRKLIDEAAPDFTNGRWMLSIVLMLAAVAAWRAVLSLALPHAASQAEVQQASQWSTEDRWSSIGTLVLHVGAMLLFVYAPYWFCWAVIEDHPVENASAVFWFVGTAFAVAAYLKARRHAETPRFQLILLLALCVFTFVSGMEEVSWFQRVFSIKTPAVIAHFNSQGELNFHNMMTNILENYFYNGMSVLLVLIPSMNALGAIRLHDLKLGVMVPRAYLVTVGAIAAAYNYDMWDIPHFQVALYMSVLLLWTLAWRTESRADRTILLMTIVAAVVGQVVFLSFGDHYIRLWDITEYKEMFMPLGAMLYAWNVFVAIKRAEPSVTRSRTAQEPFAIRAH